MLHTCTRRPLADYGVSGIHKLGVGTLAPSKT